MAQASLVISVWSGNAARNLDEYCKNSFLFQRAFEVKSGQTEQGLISVSRPRNAVPGISVCYPRNAVPNIIDLSFCHK